MKMRIQIQVGLIAIFIVLILGGLYNRAIAGGGGRTAIAVCDYVHSACELEKLYKEFNLLMDQYDREVSAEKKKQILHK